MRDPMLGHVQRKPRTCAACTSFRMSACSVLLVVLGVVLLLVAVFVPKVIDTKLDDGISDFVSISPDAQAKNSDGFRTWVNSADPDSQPIYQQVFLFNITNPAEIMAGAKPHVTEHGPYVYLQVKQKFNISYTTDDNNYEVVQFKERVYYEFQAGMTPPGLNPLTDKYTTLNYAAMGLVSVANNTMDRSNIQWLGQLGFKFGLMSCGYGNDLQKVLFDVLSVEQVMFGYTGCAGSPITGPVPFPGLMGPNIFPYGPNAQTDEQVGASIAYDQIYTGAGAPEQARQYLMWKNQTYISTAQNPTNPTNLTIAWGTTEANRVYGTSGDQFARDLKEGSTVRVWVDQLMRHAPLLNQGTSDVHGIKLLKYGLDPKLLKNSSQVPSNAAYFMDRFNGLQSLYTVKNTLNIQMSKPHFLDADQAIFDSITGLSAPDRTIHDTTLEVEPRTGVSMRVGKRLQVNYLATPFFLNTTGNTGTPQQWFQNMGASNNLGGTFLPLAWIGEEGEISSSKASDFKSQVYGAENASKYLRLAGGIVGAIVVAAAAILFVLARNRAWDEADEARETKDMHAQQQY